VAALFGLPGPGGGGKDDPGGPERSTDQLLADIALMSEAQRVANFGSWEWRVREDQVVWSDHLYRIFGLDPAKFTASVEGYLQQVHPDDRLHVRAQIDLMLGGKNPLRFEHRIVRPGGDVRSLRSLAEPIVDPESGEVVRVVGVCQDVTELFDAERERDEADARFRSAFENAPIGIALVDFTEGAEGRLTQVNRALSDLTGKAPGELVGSALTAIALSEDAEVDLALRERLVAGEIDRFSVEKRAVLDDRLVWLQLNVSTLPDGDGGPVHGIVQVQDVTERKRFEDQLRYIADHDSLTGLMNRRRFREELESRLALQERYGGEAAMLLVDVDRLKEINDTRGHQAGDQVLRKVADTMRRRMRATDIVARLSGDEFAVLLHNAGSDQAALLGEELIARLAGEQVEGFSIGVSVGVVAFGGPARHEARTIEELTAAADAAMYRAKQQGGAVAAVAPRERVADAPSPEGRPAEARPPEAQPPDSPAPEAPVERRLRLAPAGPIAARVRAALDAGRLVLYAQPAIDLRSGEVAHREVLVRLRDEGGDMTASEFMAAAAQQPGLCADIDRWVVSQALALLAGGSRQSRLHVNLSGETLRDHDALAWILRELASSEHTASLGLEVGEAWIRRDVQAATGALRELAATGCPLILDGFSGASDSFDFLQRLPLDQVKIEGVVTRELLDENPATIRAVVRLAHGTGKTTVAKLVDAPGLVPELRVHGVDMAQGFELAQPAPLAA
jgi:diguanylate cyclase (GGDEF)-like protein/PAS domain S-box-containing protein